MSDIGAWLDRQGLGRYAQVFAENDIDLDVLPELDEEELKELGVSLGHRKKIQKALLEPEAAEEPTPASVTVAPSGEAERRQLTVMFCDLVGSTALSESMDPEDYRELLSAYQTTAVGAIREHDGYVARYMGDGLLVYFGYPVAQENDPERGARAGLAVIDAIAALECPTPLQVRIGVATGPVVVGDIVGEGASQEATVLGETPNLAARLQGAAAPNTVMLSPATQALLRGRVETAALQPLELKGLSQPVVPYRAVRPLSLSEVSESRLDSTPLIGRDVEVALIDRAWQRACASEGQALLLSGEPGVGKSRLLRAFQEGVEAATRTRVQWHCSPYFQTTANYPAIEQLKRSMNGESLKAIESLVLDLGLDINVLVPPLALLLSIPLSDRYAAPDWSPDDLKRRLIQAQVELLLAAAEQAPVLFVIEDLHWVDPTTLEVLGEMIAAIRDQRVLVLMTARPEFSPAWVNQAHATTQRLSNLSRNETMALVRGMVDEHGLSAAWLEQIVERTDGVPLFVEELTRGLLESHGETTIPASLQDSLMTRLDRLGTTKELAQMASVVGRTFSTDDLVPLAERRRESIETQLQEVVDSGLAHRLAAGRYEFKHALVRDAAYDSMLRSTRRVLHGRYAEHLEASGIGETQPELLAEHYAEAGECTGAVRAWMIAGNRSLTRSAVAEAAAHFRAAIEALVQVPADEERTRTEIEARTSLGQAYVGQYGRGDSAPLSEFTAAIRLCEGIEDDSLKIPALRGLSLSLASNRPADALEPAHELEALARTYADTEAELAAEGAIVGSNYLLGRFAIAHRRAKQRLKSLERSDLAPAAVSAAIYNAGIELRRHCAMASDALGLRDSASTMMSEARAMARDTRQPFVLAHTLIYSAKLMIWQRFYTEAQEFAAEGLELANGHGFGNWRAACQVLLGRALSATGNASRGLTTMKEGILGWVSPSWHTEWRTHYAQALLDEGRIEEARIVLEEAQSILRSVGAAQYSAECQRLMANIAVRQGRENDAEELLKSAVKIARDQEARTFQLQAAMDLSELWRNKGKAVEAGKLLAPIYSGFIEGFSTPALLKAKALLNELE